MKYSVIIIQQDSDGNMEKVVFDQTLEPWEMRQLGAVGNKLHRVRPVQDLPGQTSMTDEGDGWVA